MRLRLPLSGGEHLIVDCHTFDVFRGEHHKPFAGISNDLAEAAIDYAYALTEDVVPWRKYPLDATSSWSFTGADGNKLLGPDGHNWSRFRRAHTIVRGGGTPAVKAKYALPHHKLKGEHMTTFFKGVVAAAQRRGQTKDITDAERKGAGRHLARHYREFDKEPPASLTQSMPIPNLTEAAIRFCRLR